MGDPGGLSINSLLLLLLLFAIRRGFGLFSGEASRLLLLLLWLWLWLELWLLVRIELGVLPLRREKLRFGVQLMYTLVLL